MAAVALILVRHGSPTIDPDTPPPQWGLSPEGRPAVAALGGVLARFVPRAAISSPEPKAIQTAEILASAMGLEVDIDPNLGEHSRPSFSFGAEAEFLARMATVFANPKVSTPGDESADEAYYRVAATLARHPLRPLMAVTHGTVLSLYVARRLGLNAHDLWRSLKTPEAFVIDSEGALIARLS